MKRPGLGLLLAGLLLLLGSCAQFGLVVQRVVGAEAAFRAPVTAGAAYESPLFEVDTRERIQLAIRGEVNTRYTEERDGDYRAQYHFPLHYELLTASGEVVAAESTELSHEHGSRSFEKDRLGPLGGSVVIETGLEKLAVPPPGELRVRLYLEEDQRFGATLRDAELIVYHRVHVHTPTVLGGVAMAVFGTLALLAGALLLIVDGVRRAPPADAAASEGRQLAVICHASALAGYVIPFGGLLGPLVVWLVAREKDAFVDEQGREAINFRLSMYIYYLASVLLLFLLIGFVLLPLLALFDLVMVVVAAVRASGGEHFRYPLSIRFV